MADTPREKTGLELALEAEEAMFPLPTPDEHDAGVLPTSVTTVAAAVPEATPPAEPAAPTPPPSVPPTEPGAPPAPTPEPAQPTSPAPTPVPVVPPTEPTPTPVEADGAPWKAKREAERREREALAELNAAREREQQLLREIQAARTPLPTPQAPTPTEPIDDPLLAVEDRLNKTERLLAEQTARNQQIEQSVQRQGRDTALAREADAFTREHADFPAARDFYIQKKIEEAERTGELDAVAADLRQRVPDQIRNAARERGVTEAQLSRDLAQAVIFENRLSLMERSAAARGKSVVATVYEEAQAWGFSGNGNGNGTPVAIPPTPTPAAVAVNPALSAAEQLRREQAVAAASSLATMPSSPAAPVGGGSLTYAGFLAMGTAEQSRLIDQLDTAARYNLVPEDWSEQLQNGKSVPVPDSAQLRARMEGV